MKYADKTTKRCFEVHNSYSWLFLGRSWDTLVNSDLCVVFYFNSCQNVNWDLNLALNAKEAELDCDTHNIATFQAAALIFQTFSLEGTPSTLIATDKPLCV